MKSSLALVLTISLAALSACGKDEKSSSSSGSSAAEIFAMRTQCTKLGEDLLAQGVRPSSVRAEQKSKYDSGDNRCYVELDFSPADPTASDYQSTRYLYDGQTKQVLAFYRQDHQGDGPAQLACSVSNNPKLWVPDPTACDLVFAKITDVMADNGKP